MFKFACKAYPTEEIIVNAKTAIQLKKISFVFL